MVLFLNKNRGETPLECLERYKKDNPEYAKEKMTYAGRLDPLAEGMLLVLVGEECKNREKYLSLDKEYEVDILFGFSTDSYDVLGKVIKSIDSEIIVKTGDVKKIIKTFVKKFNQKYPPFSSKTVDGVPLFIHTKNNTLDLEDVPSKEVEIKNIEFVGERTISKIEFEKFVKESVDLVSGDFRQEEVLKSWKQAFLKNKNNNFPIITIKVSCTSGTYMRSLVNSIGDKLGIPALAKGIKRIRIGDKNLKK